jgi:hypothetical protein
MEDEESEFTHPGLRMYRDAGGFHVVLPVKAQRFRRLLHVVWLLVWVAGEAALAASLGGWSALPAPPLPILIAFTAAFTAAGVFMIYRLLWYWAGRESFHVTKDQLVVERKMLGIGPTWKFDRSKVLDLRGGRLDYQVIYPSWGRTFIGHGDGEIVLETSHGVHSFAKGLEENEAETLAGLLRMEVQGGGTSVGRRPSEVRAG